ncbi:MAG TPA: UUP1 family membrane protein [Burkholderiales bacterium]|nr:UUP1 family membrane protein [Burkholderiales bacterium]
MRRLHLVILAALLAAAGLAFFGYKVLRLGFPLTPAAQTEVWRIEVHARFDANDGPVKLALKTPTQTGYATVIDQGFSARGYGVTTERAESNRRAIYARRDARGRQDVYYRVVIDIGRAGGAPEETKPMARAPSFRADALPAAQSLLDAAQAESADARSLAATLIKRLLAAKPGEPAAYLLGRDPSPARLVAVAVDLLRLAGTPARVVNGLALHPERRNAQFTRWFEVHDGVRWFAVYPGETSRAAQRLLLPWWRGQGPLVELEGGANLATEVTVSRSYELGVRAAVAQQRAQERQLIEFSLFGLPLQSQSLFRTLLVIPLGVFLLVVLRNVIGFKTFGTFMPVLIALAFRQTGLAAGIVFFVIVLALGLAVRLYVERLQLLLVPRLGAVLIVVIGLMAALTIVSHRMGLDVGLSVGLFPMVILTMTIERMTVTWEERGAAEALQQAAGSLAVAALCFVIISRETVEHLFFVFPELLLVLLAATLLLGRYTGYRVLEVLRFQVLAK